MMATCAANPIPSIRQHTVQQSAPLHTARHRRRSDVLAVHPADADTGVRFFCNGTMSEAMSIIPAHWDAVTDTNGGIALGNLYGITLRGTIPLLAALRVAGIDNAIVEVHGSRIPAEISDFDFYFDVLSDVGVRAQDQERHLLRVTETVEVRDNIGFLKLTPSTGFRACANMTTMLPDGNSDEACATLACNFNEPSAGFSLFPDELHDGQVVEVDATRALQPLREIRALPEPLRATLIEMIGHLALVGAPVAANVYGQSAGPRHYQALLHAVMERRALTRTTVDAHRAQHGTAAHTVADAAKK